MMQINQGLGEASILKCYHCLHQSNILKHGMACEYVSKNLSNFATSGDISTLSF